MSESRKRKRRGERPDGRIQVTLTDGIRKDGKPNRISFYGSTRKEAEQKRQQYIDEKKAGILAPDHSVTLGEWMDRWESVYKKTMTPTDRSMINIFRAELGHMPLMSVQEAHLVDAMSRYSGKSKGAASKYRGLIRQIFRKAKKNRLIVVDPSDDLALPENTRSGTHRALAQWEIDILLDNWRSSPEGLWSMLMMLCGMRCGEMAALDWADVDLEGRAISIHRNAVFKHDIRSTVINNFTKTEAGMRTVPICDQLYECLSSIPGEQRKGFVCCDRFGNQINMSMIARQWKSYCKSLAEYTDTEFCCQTHDLRHTYATILFEAGVDVKSAQYYLGHKSLQMTLGLYTHLSEKHTRMAGNAIREHMDNWLKSRNNS